MRQFGNWAALLAVVFGLVVLPACGTIQTLREGAAAIAANQQEIKDTVENVKKITEIAREGVENASGEVKEAVAEFKQLHAEAMVKADVNQSGGLDGAGEWLTYLIVMAAGGSGYAASKMRQGAATTKQRLDNLEQK